jgi:hypothetical protein
VSDQVLGPIGLAIKKMCESKGQVPVDLSHLPCDMLFAIYNKSVKDYENKLYFNQNETEK